MYSIHTVIQNGIYGISYHNDVTRMVYIYIYTYIYIIYIYTYIYIYIYIYTAFPPKGGTMALPHPLILKFKLKNTVL